MSPPCSYVVQTLSAQYVNTSELCLTLPPLSRWITTSSLVSLSWLTPPFLPAPFSFIAVLKYFQAAAIFLLFKIAKPCWAMATVSLNRLAFYFFFCICFRNYLTNAFHFAFILRKKRVFIFIFPSQSFLTTINSLF